MAFPTDAYRVTDAVHLIQVIDGQTDNPLFTYTAHLPLDGRGQGVTTELLQRITQTVAAFAAEKLADNPTPQSTRASLQYTGQTLTLPVAVD